MTKKHFVELARRLRAARPDEKTPMHLGWKDAVMAVCHACQQANPAFNTGTFLDACDFRRD